MTSAISLITSQTFDTADYTVARNNSVPRPVGLTARQAQAQTFIQRHIAEHGRFPTYREIAAGLGVVVSAAFVLVTKLKERGRVRESFGKLYATAPPNFYFIPAATVERGIEAVRPRTLKQALRQSIAQRSNDASSHGSDLVGVDFHDGEYR